MNPENPYDSYFLLGNNMKFEMWRMFAAAAAADLVVLSACDSAQVTAGASALGVTAVSGARWVVSSRWKADDQTTSRLMSMMYDRIADGERPSAALRSAALNIAKDNVVPF